MVPFAVLALAMFYAVWQDRSLILLSIGVFSLLASASMARTAVFLETDALRIRRFVDSVIIPRTTVHRAVPGTVQWGRSIVSGIELEEISGERRSLGFSYLPGERRRQEWIDEINRWCTDVEGWAP